MQKATLVSGQPVRHPYITKTFFRAMKLTAILLFTLSLHVTAKVSSQTINFSGKDVSLEKIFAEVEKQTGFLFFYNANDLFTALPVTVEANNISLNDFLTWVFKDQHLKFRIDNKAIIVSVKPPTGHSEHLASLLLSPPIDIKGRIVNEKGEPVVASVIIKGTTRGTTSNSKGEFELSNVDEDAVLIISSANTETILFNVVGKSSVNILVKSAINDLAEVVINKGYYTTTKRMNTGSVVTVGADEITKQPVTNPLAALIGRMPGVSVRQTSGLPGAPLDIQIRGRNSLRSDANDPLYVIDGIPFSPNNGSAGLLYYGPPSALNSVNAADIESIEILKDADATSIYGSRGANGVVLITTKKGRLGKTRAELDMYQGMGKITRTMELLNTEQYLAMRKEAYKNDNIIPTLNGGADLLEWDQNRYTDWQKKLIGNTAHATNIQGAISGGGANTYFRASGGFYRETSVFPGDFSFIKGSGNFSLQHFSDNRKFAASFAVGYVKDANNLMNENLVTIALGLAPNAPEVLLPSGELNWAGKAWQNPYSYLRKKNLVENDNLIVSSSLSYQLLPGLQLKTNLGYNTFKNEQQTTTPISYWNPAYNVTTGSSGFISGFTRTWIIEPQAQYEHKAGKATIGFLAGVTFQENNNKQLSLAGEGYTNDALLENVQAAPSVYVYSATDLLYRYNGMYGRLNMNWDNKYLLNLTARRDGSSRFGPQKQFANFGAIGAAWLFSQETFLKESNSVISFGKLRFSYGTSGSDQIPDYGFMDTYTSTSLLYNGNKGLYPTRLVNTDYSWETNRKMDIGLELGLWKSNIFFTMNWFRNRSSNQLVGYPLSGVTGQSTVQYNLPATVQNTGWEFELATTNINQGKFSWKSTFNFTLPDNKLVSYPGLAGSSYANTYVIGQPLSIRKSYKYLGVDPETGVYEFEDIDKNGLLNNADRQTIVFVGQKYFGGIQNVVRYKGFELDFLFQFVKQAGINYKGNGFFLPGFFGFNSGNQPADILQRWQNPGDHTDVQKFSQDLNASGGAYESFSNLRSYGENAVSDASFIRLKNLSLSWQIGKTGTNNKSIQWPRVYLTAQNLLTITNYKGLDPEQGVVGYLPPLKMVTLGFRQTF